MRRLPCSPLSPMAASKACQIAMAIMPIAMMTSRVLPERLAGQLLQRAGLVALLRRTAERDLQRQPGEEKVDDAVSDEAAAGRYSSGLLSAAREAVLLRARRQTWQRD